MALVALLAGTRVQAQGQVLFDVSGGSTRHQFAEPGTTFSLAPRFLWRGAGSRLDIGLTYTRGASFRWNAEGGLDGAVSKRLGGGLSAELGTSGWWTVHPIGQGTGQLVVNPALRLSRRTVDLSLEGGAGHASTITGGRWFGLMGARARWFLGPLDVQGLVQRTQFGGKTLRWTSFWDPVHLGGDTLAGAGRDTLVRVADSLGAIRAYSDVGVTVGWLLAGTRLSVGVEQRLGAREFRATAWHAEATHALAAEMALFASAGRTLSVLTAGLPARRYLALGVRWAPGSRRLNAGPARAPDARSIRIERDNEAFSRVLLHARGAVSVEVMGDFSNWEPLPLTGGDQGWWLLPTRLLPGLYRFNVRYDGGRWETPAGLPSEADEFNGRVGVLLIVP